MDDDAATATAPASGGDVTARDYVRDRAGKFAHTPGGGGGAKPGSGTGGRTGRGPGGYPRRLTIPVAALTHQEMKARLADGSLTHQKIQRQIYGLNRMSPLRSALEQKYDKALGGKPWPDTQHKPPDKPHAVGDRVIYTDSKGREYPGKVESLHRFPRAKEPNQYSVRLDKTGKPMTYPVRTVPHSMLRPEGKGKPGAPGGGMRPRRTATPPSPETAQRHAELTNLGGKPSSRQGPGGTPTAPAGDTGWQRDYVKPQPGGWTPDLTPAPGVKELTSPGRPQPPATGAADDPVDVRGDLDKALTLMQDGQHVRLNQVDEIAVLLDKIDAIAKSSKEPPPDWDFGLLTVKGTNLFTAQTKGIPRINMPQFSGLASPGTDAARLAGGDGKFVDLTPQLGDQLKREGIKVTAMSVPASHLRATQTELVGSKVAGFANAVRAGVPKAVSAIKEPIYVTRDHYVVDGHHRWAANMMLDSLDGKLGNDTTQNVLMVDMDIGAMIPYSNAFAARMGIAGRGGVKGAAWLAAVRADVELGMDPDVAMAAADAGLAAGLDLALDALAAAGPNPDQNRGNAETLRRYWGTGEGSLKIRWGTPGDHSRCVDQLVEHGHFTTDQAHGYCNLLEKRVTGQYPAQHAQKEKAHAAGPFATAAAVMARFDAAQQRVPPGGPGGGQSGSGGATPTNEKPVQNGQSGQTVKFLQQRLNALGAKPPLAVDGKFGPLTLAAVKKYQASQGLKVDGLVGPLTTGTLRAKVQKGAPAVKKGAPATTTSKTTGGGTATKAPATKAPATPAAPAPPAAPKPAPRGRHGRAAPVTYPKPATVVHVHVHADAPVTPGMALAADGDDPDVVAFTWRHGWVKIGDGGPARPRVFTDSRGGMPGRGGLSAHAQNLASRLDASSDKIVTMTAGERRAARKALRHHDHPAASALADRIGAGQAQVPLSAWEQGLLHDALTTALTGQHTARKPRHNPGITDLDLAYADAGVEAVGPGGWSHGWKRDTPQFAKGTKVRIHSGQYAGHTGTVSSEPSPNRPNVAVVRREDGSTVLVHHDNIQPADEPPRGPEHRLTGLEKELADEANRAAIPAKDQIPYNDQRLKSGRYTAKYLKAHNDDELAQARETEHSILQNASDFDAQRRAMRAEDSIKAEQERRAARLVKESRPENQNLWSGVSEKELTRRALAGESEAGRELRRRHGAPSVPPPPYKPPRQGGSRGGVPAPTAGPKLRITKAEKRALSQLTAIPESQIGPHNIDEVRRKARGPRAAAPDTGPPAEVTVPALVTVPAVDILAAGTWQLSTGRQTFTRDDLEQAVEAAKCPAIGAPVIKIGHLDQRFAPQPGQDGEPAIGKVTNLRLNDSGTKVLGDLAGMPGWLGAIAASAFPRRSVEGKYRFTCQIGHQHPFVLTALALLGVTPPGVGVLGQLDDIAALYGVNAAADPGWQAEQTQEGTVMPVTEEDVRRAWYAAGGAPPSWWITELQMAPAQLIVADEESGAVYRVPFDIEGSAVTFGDADEIVSYAAMAAARGAGPAVVYASAAESRLGVGVVMAGWDGAAAVRNLGDDPSPGQLRALFAIPGATKGDSSLPHHDVSPDGKVGAANPDACSAAIAALNGARGGLVGASAASKKAAHGHLAAHLRSAGKEPPGLTAAADYEPGIPEGEPGSDVEWTPADRLARLAAIREVAAAAEADEDVKQLVASLDATLDQASQVSAGIDRSKLDPDTGQALDLITAAEAIADQLMDVLGIYDPDDPGDDGDESAAASAEPAAARGDAGPSGKHGDYSGEHSHPHPTTGDQGDDTTHEHMHRHNGDAGHDHAHETQAAAPAAASQEGSNSSMGFEFTDQQMAAIRSRLGKRDGEPVTTEEVFRALDTPRAPVAASAAGSSADPDVQAPQIGDGTYLVDGEILRKYQERAVAGDQALHRLHLNERDQILASAVNDGKFSLARKPHFEALWDKDPEGTRGLVAKLAPGLVPMGPPAGFAGEFGGDPDMPGDFEGQQAYRDLYPEDYARERQQRRAGTGA